MLRRSLILLIVILLDVLWGLAAGGRFAVPHLTLMYLVARTIHGFDYTTPLCAFPLAFMFDSWRLDVFGGHAVTWLLTLLVVAHVVRFFYANQISTHLVLGFGSSLLAGFIEFVLWSSWYRPGTPLSGVTAPLLRSAVIDAVVLAALYRLSYGQPARRPAGMLWESNR